MQIPGGKRTQSFLAWVIVLIVGVSLSLIGFVAVRRAEHESTRTKAHSVSVDRVVSIRREVDDVLERLRALRAFYGSSVNVTPEELNRFLSQSRHGIDPEVTFTWCSSSGLGTNNFHVYPSTSNTAPAAVFWARQDIRELTQRARKTGDLLAIRQSLAGVRASSSRQIIILAALHVEGTDHTSDSQSYVAAILSVERMAERAIAYLAPGGIDVSIVDPVLPDAQRVIYFHASRKGIQRTQPQTSPDIRFTEPLDIAGLRHWIVCDTAPDLVKNGYSKTGWVMLISGLLASLAFAWWVRDRIGVANRIQQLVDQRTQELAHARDEAVQASRLKSQFLANVSHELRTPLNGIIGMTGFLLETPLDSQQRDLASTVWNSSNALLAIVNDLLDMSRIEAGKLSFEYAPLNVRDACGNAVAGLRSMAEEKHLSLQLEIGPDVPTQVLGDAIRLQQVLLNLLHNAIKFTDHGSICTIVTLDAEDDNSFTLRFAVRDSGSGVPPESRDVIFQRFAQADGSNARRHGGLGLGLALCQQIVNMMHGKIDFESQPGVGSTFWFTAVVHKCTPLVLSPESSPLASLPLAPPGTRLLLAEDNPVNRKVASHMLARLGYSFDEVTNGHEVLDAINKHHYAAILMDCQMPLLDGFEATARIRSTAPPGQHIPIIALTANAMPGDRERCLATGMDDYLAKPIQLDALSAVLARWTAAPTSPIPSE